MKTEVQLGLTGMKVFSATMVRDRETLGEKVTEWIRDMQSRGSFRLTDYQVTQSSDHAFHCVTITVFYTTVETAEDARRKQIEDRHRDATARAKGKRKLPQAEPAR